MTYADLIRELAPMIKYFGADHFPPIVLQRIHAKTRDLDRDQIKELMNLILDNCEFAPKVPKVVEFANIVRARHREGVANITTDPNERTTEAGEKAIATIRNIFGDKNRMPS